MCLNAHTCKEYDFMIAFQVVAENDTLKKDTVRVALTGITEGSIGLTFSPNLKELTLPAANLIAEAMNTNNYDSFFTGSINALKRVTAFTQRHECKAEFYANNGSTSASPILNFRIISPFRNPNF